MAQNAGNPQTVRAHEKRRERIRIVWYIVFLGFGLYAFDIVTGEISGGYPFLRMAIRAKESEGKQYVGSINRAQQAYFLEKKKFATSIAPLELGISAETDNYRYRIVPQTDPQTTIATGDAKQKDIKNWRGAVRQVTAKDGKRTTIAILCAPVHSRQSWLYGTPKPPALPYYSKEDKTLHCGEGSVDVSR